MISPKKSIITPKLSLDMPKTRIRTLPYWKINLVSWLHTHLNVPGLDYIKLVFWLPTNFYHLSRKCLLRMFKRLPREDKIEKTKRDLTSHR